MFLLILFAAISIPSLIFSNDSSTVLKNSETNKFVTGAVCNYRGEYIIEDVEPGESRSIDSGSESFRNYDCRDWFLREYGFLRSNFRFRPDS